MNTTKSGKSIKECLDTLKEIGKVEVKEIYTKDGYLKSKKYNGIEQELTKEEKQFKYFNTK